MVGSAVNMGNSAGIKDDHEKVPVELIDPIWLIGTAKVLGFGRRKYAAWNWKKGLAVTRVLGAALRHILAFLGGEDIDADSKQPHLYCASCELMFACVMMETRPDLDDRYKENGPDTTGGVGQKNGAT